MMMLVFKSLLNYPKGTLESILAEAYSSFHKNYPEYGEENLKKFNECDSFFYENPQIGEDCSFVSEYEGMIAGMCCWDLREKPTVIIGHNCILPKLRGKGLGTGQMRMTLNHLRDKGFTKAKVSTGRMDFFIPAQKMYEAVGFKEVSRDNPDASSQIKLHHHVYYEMELQ
jgi:GNAT superfamily N-acetyltransferase